MITKLKQPKIFLVLNLFNNVRLVFWLDKKSYNFLAVPVLWQLLFAIAEACSTVQSRMCGQSGYDWHHGGSKSWQKATESHLGLL